MDKMEKKLKNMNLENLEKMEIEKKKSIKKPKPVQTYKLNISQFEQNKKAKETTIFNIIKKIKLQNDLKANYELKKDEFKRPYNLNITKGYIFLPFCEFIFGSFICIFTYKKKLNLNTFGFSSCFLAIANEISKNFFFHKNFKNEFENYLQVNRNYNKIMDSYTSTMGFGKIWEHYFKLEKINVRNKKVLEIIVPEREKYYEKEAFQELMFVFEMLAK